MGRVELHQQLVDILGSNYVYYQPPESVKLTYPCIIYTVARKIGVYGNNHRYFKGTGYTITLVTTSVDDSRCAALEELPYCSFDRHYTSDNLHHYTYTIYI